MEKTTGKTKGIKTVNKKNALKELINSIDFLTEQQKYEWILVSDILNETEINSVYDEFIKAQEQENEVKLEAIFKAGLGEEYKEKIKEISAGFKNTARKKEEEYQSKQDGGAEDILNKLDNL